MAPAVLTGPDKITPGTGSSLDWRTRTRSPYCLHKVQLGRQQCWRDARGSPLGRSRLRGGEL